jgi:hypothetical protein
MRILAACAFAFLATCAVAEGLVLDDVRVQYSYTFETLARNISATLQRPCQKLRR